jgi:hypothetical protein
MGFRPSKADRDIGMRRVGDHYKNIVVYVDDLRIVVFPQFNGSSDRVQKLSK